MAHSTPQIRATLRAELLARVIEGESVAGACRAAAHLPVPTTVGKWARRDPAFAAALAEARAQGRARAAARKPPFDAALARVFLDRYRAGETLQGLLADPAMPSRRVYDRWRLAEPEFQLEMLRLKQARFEETVARNVAARARPFDPVLADRIVTGVFRGETLEALLARDPDLPCETLVRRWRRADPDLDTALRICRRAWAARRQAQRQSKRTPALERRILDGIVLGGSLFSLSRRRGMPSHNTLYRWVREDPDFAAKVDHACEVRREWYADQIVGLSEAGGAARSQIVALSRQMARLENRPGKRGR